MTHIAVIGGGQAAVALIVKLRACGFGGPITLFGAEAHLPYQRPALSKKYLTGEMSAERLLLRPRRFYEENGIALRLGAPVTGLDPSARTLSQSGRTFAYDRLALTTGSAPRRLPAAVEGRDLSGVHVLRSLDDVDALAPEFRPGRRVLIVGGGYIGLEAAAVARKIGLEVFLVEAGERILGRVASAETAHHLRDLHVARGVTILEGVGVRRLCGEGAVSGAELSDGRRIAADFVIAGVGVVPCTGLAEAAGLACDNGVVVDERCRTSAPGVWAAGDCASLAWKGGRIRLECVQNAIDQAEAAALDMLEMPVRYDPKPWFWSEQYETRLQIAGLNLGHDRIVDRPGESGRSIWYYSGEALCAVDAIDDPRAYFVGRKLLQDNRSPDPAVIADASVDLKSLLG